jgi:hypothetical protein
MEMKGWPWCSTMSSTVQMERVEPERRPLPHFPPAPPTST